MRSPRRRLRILTWHVHGNYLYSLTRIPHDFVIPYKPGTVPGYSPLGPRIPWGSNITACPAEEIAGQDVDCVIYQSRQVYEEDRLTLLSPLQRALPSIYLEHDPPQPHPTNTTHGFRHERGVLVHVTHYNDLAWDAAGMPTRVIEHGVPVQAGLVHTGEQARGITVINGLAQRGRRMGADLFQWTREQVPLDLIGMQSEALGGLGELPNLEVARRVASYRFFYTPIRYTSLGLALVEAMLIGVPVVGVAATELPTVIVNGVNGFVHTDRRLLVDCMRQLLEEPALARQWGEAGRRTALERFGMPRFIDDWNRVLDEVTG
ncbi:LPS biosynthesis transferase [Achromobacter aloeverae]|uniref:LPS biosynthesis transferase n=1 Tax=Achromobacter aloeverae TaxID=1750518 RepID=A0A4Q1HGU2_9BURK|nr:LPS biosynthesis transferase [Achromobacter aloeverae]